MRIGLDFDGVIVDSAAMKAKQIKNRFGVVLPHAVLHRGSTTRGGAPGISFRQYNEAKRDVYWRAPTASEMIPVPGAIWYAQKLVNDGHSIFVISSRSRRSARFARSWCKQKRLPLTLVMGVGMDRIDKSEAARKYELDVFVDNDLEKLLLLDGVVRHKFLFTWHNNLHDDVGGVAERVFGSSGLYEAIRRINENT